jgi:phosphoribosylanthranilate isomerase
VLELPRVKVCGMTRAEDVDVAVRAGADAVGFVHHPPSPRHVEPGAARALIERLPAGVLAVAVLVDATPASARACLAASGARAVQLCGAEHARDFRGFPAPILRRLPVGFGAREVIARWQRVAAGFVLDHPSGPGGTGLSVDLDAAALLAARVPCLLAGGLTPDNVAERVRVVCPRGVDGASRLESAPGEKDPARVLAFVTAARAALETLRSGA